MTCLSSADWRSDLRRAPNESERFARAGRNTPREPCPGVAILPSEGGMMPPVHTRYAGSEERTEPVRPRRHRRKHAFSRGLGSVRGLGSAPGLRFFRRLRFSRLATLLELTVLLAC